MAIKHMKILLIIVIIINTMNKIMPIVTVAVTVQQGSSVRLSSGSRHRKYHSSSG